MNLNKFFAENITSRTQNMFEDDIVINQQELEQKINNKTALVIGAGSVVLINVLDGEKLVGNPAKII